MLPQSKTRYSRKSSIKTKSSLMNMNQTEIRNRVLNKTERKTSSHKYYRLHEDRRRFELGLRFYRSSFSYLSVDRKNRYQYANSKQRKQSVAQTSIGPPLPPYWNANSKTLEPSLLQAPEDVDSAVICAFPWQGSYLPPFIYQFLDSFN